MRTPVLAALSAAAAVSLLAAGTAAAQPTTTTPAPPATNKVSASQEVNLTVIRNTGGGLSVNTGGGSSTLNLAQSGKTATGSLTAFSVTDTRGTTTGWNAYVSLTDFEHASIDDAVIPATKATYHPPASANGLVFGGTANRTAENIPLSNDDALFMTRTNRTTATTLEVASWANLNGMSVDLSEGAALGQYSATLTLSAL